MLKLHLRQIDQLDRSIQELEAQAREATAPFRHRVGQLTAVPGISETAASVLLAEIGTDMSVFPSAGHLPLFHRLKSRRGPKKAIVAVAASILTTVYHLLRDGTVYQDLGMSHFDSLNRDRAAKSLLRRLQALGFDVEVKPAAT